MRVALYDRGCRFVRMDEAVMSLPDGYQGEIVVRMNEGDEAKEYLVTGRVADTLIATESLT